MWFKLLSGQGFWIKDDGPAAEGINFDSMLLVFNYIYVGISFKEFYEIQSVLHHINLIWIDEPLEYIALKDIVSRPN